MARSKLVHKLFLGFLVGIVLGFIAFFAVNTFVTATNAIAVAAGDAAPGPYNPPWAIPLAAFAFAFIVPIAGVISMDFDERQSENVTTQPAQPYIMDIGPNLTQALPAILEIQKAQGQKQTPDGPPKP
jgi:hypothetical protein